MTVRAVISFRPKGGAAERARDWSAPMKEKGLEVIDLPLLEVVDALSGADRLANIDPGSWLLFTSANAAYFALPYLGDRSFSVACIGEQTASLLREQGRTVQFVPSRADAKSFAEELVPVLHRTEPAPRCVFLRGQVVSPHLVAGLEEAGIAVEEIIAYETRPTALSASALELLRERAGGKDTALLFTNSESLRELVERAEQWGLDLEKLRFNPTFAIGPETEKSLRKEGFAEVQVANHASMGSLVEKIIASLK